MHQHAYMNTTHTQDIHQQLGSSSTPVGLQHHSTTALKGKNKKEQKPSCWCTFGRPTGKTEPIQVMTGPKRMPAKHQHDCPAVHLLSSFLASFISYLSDSYSEVQPILTNNEDILLGSKYISNKCFLFEALC